MRALHRSSLGEEMQLTATQSSPCTVIVTGRVTCCGDPARAAQVPQTQAPRSRHRYFALVRRGRAPRHRRPRQARDGPSATCAQEEIGARGWQAARGQGVSSDRRDAAAGGAAQGSGIVQPDPLRRITLVTLVFDHLSQNGRKLAQKAALDFAGKRPMPPGSGCRCSRWTSGCACGRASRATRDGAARGSGRAPATAINGRGTAAAGIES